MLETTEKYLNKLFVSKIFSMHSDLRYTKKCNNFCTAYQDLDMSFKIYLNYVDKVIMYCGNYYF